MFRSLIRFRCILPHCRTYNTSAFPLPRIEASNSVSLVKQVLHIPSRCFGHGPPLSKPMIEDRIMLVLRLYDKITPEKLTLHSQLQKDFGLDSLDMVEVIMVLEEEFGFDIPDDEALRLKSPADIAQYICDKHDIYS